MDNRSHEPSLPQNKKPSVIWKIIVFLSHSLFPYFKFRKINSLLEACNETYIPHSLKNKFDDANFPKESIWFRKQKRWNILLSIVVPLIYIGGIFASKQVIVSNPVIAKAFDVSLKLVKQFKFTDAKNKIALANRLDPNFSYDLKLAFYIFGGSFLLAFLLGTYITRRNPLFKKTEDFENVLLNLGFLKKEEETVILYTPLGILYKLSPGGSAREILSQDRIWSSLNIEVGEYLENSQNRQLVFFKKKYPLKEGGEYGYDRF